MLPPLRKRGVEWFLTLVEEDELAERVLEDELFDVVGVVRLADVRAACKRLVEADVLELRLLGGKERDEREPGVRTHLAELERQDCAPVGGGGCHAA